MKDVEHPACNMNMTDQSYHMPSLVLVLLCLLLRSGTLAFIVLNLLVFIWLNQWFLLDHLVLILPVICLIGCLGTLGGAENWTVLPSFHGVMFCLLSSVNACIFHLSDGKGSPSYSME